jgi:hypothetical protein
LEIWSNGFKGIHGNVMIGCNGWFDEVREHVRALYNTI